MGNTEAAKTIRCVAASMNTWEHSAFNIERPISKQRPQREHWALKVECWTLIIFHRVCCNGQGSRISRFNLYSAFTGVNVTGPSRPQSVSGQLEASKGL